jgi:hypothetical protein
MPTIRATNRHNIGLLAFQHFTNFGKSQGSIFARKCLSACTIHIANGCQMTYGSDALGMSLGDMPTTYNGETV